MTTVKQIVDTNGTVLEFNGYRVSIQHSSRHACSTHTVEVAVIRGKGRKAKFVDVFPYAEHGVASYVTGAQLRDILQWVLDQKNGSE
jgi:hypothetical protein